MSRKVQAIYLWWHKPVFDQELLQSLPNLKVIANSGVGMDHLDLTLVASFGAEMANAPRAVSSSTADTGMALLLASARRIVEGYHIAVSSDMEYCESDFLGVQVTGATLGIVGMGSIGYKIALRAKAFEMNISYHSRTRREEIIQRHSFAIGSRRLYTQSPIIASFVPKVQAAKFTKNRRNGKYSFLLRKVPTKNLSIPPHTAEVRQIPRAQSLLGGLGNLTISFPLSSRDHALLQLKNVIITPHLGGKTDKATRMISEEVVENILAALKGLLMASEVLPS
ncbi:HPPR reductase, partial [Corythaixoides concolor]|nr:HPPR reductase [Corythaixoides concolor]